MCPRSRQIGAARREGAGGQRRKRGRAPGFPHSAGAAENRRPSWFSVRLRRGDRYPPSEPGLAPRRVAGAVGGNRGGLRRGVRDRPSEPGLGPGEWPVLSAGTTARYGEASVTGPANRALGPVSGRCVGEVPPRGAKRSGGFQGGRPPWASTGSRGSSPLGQHRFQGVVPPGPAQVPGGRPPWASTGSRGSSPWAKPRRALRPR
jgi:hypothetical protein